MERRRKYISYVMLFVAMAFIVYGSYRGEIDSVFSKAIKICLECVGIG